jgi:hypothetical protein
MKLTVETSIMLVLCFTMIGAAIAQTQAVVGVKQGDVFTYNFMVFWSSNSTGSPPSQLAAFNETEWLRVTVTGVSNSTISTQITIHFRNETEGNSTGTFNVDTGEDLGGPPFIGAGLAPNETVYPSGSPGLVMNDTVTRKYTSGDRETNNLIEDAMGVSNYGNYTGTAEYFFDKDTGALVEYSTNYIYPDQTVLTRSVITSSSVWAVQSSPSPTPPSISTSPSTATPQSSSTPTSSSLIPTSSDVQTEHILIAAAAVIIVVAVAVLLVIRRRRS